LFPAEQHLLFPAEQLNFPHKGDNLLNIGKNIIKQLRPSV